MDKGIFHILLDNGHGSNTPGKCSPDKSIREYSYVRELVAGIADRLIIDGYNVHLVTPELTDISLKERCRRINELCRQYGALNCLSVSVHINAAGSDGQWHNASGWQVCVAQRCSINSMELASSLAKSAEHFFKVRRPLPAQDYWPMNLAMCRDTACPAVLTENLFQDCHKDVDTLLSPEGFNDIVSLHVNGIQDYIKSL